MVSALDLRIPVPTFRGADPVFVLRMHAYSKTSHRCIRKLFAASTELIMANVRTIRKQFAVSSGLIIGEDRFCLCFVGGHLRASYSIQIVLFRCLPDVKWNNVIRAGITGN